LRVVLPVPYHHLVDQKRVSVDKRDAPLPVSLTQTPSRFHAQRRNFAPDRIGVHEQVCKKSALKAKARELSSAESEAGNRARPMRQPTPPSCKPRPKPATRARTAEVRRPPSGASPARAATPTNPSTRAVAAGTNRRDDSPAFKRWSAADPWCDPWSGSVDAAFDSAAPMSDHQHQHLHRQRTATMKSKGASATTTSASDGSNESATDAQWDSTFHHTAVAVQTATPAQSLKGELDERDAADPALYRWPHAEPDTEIDR
jgi:hypothetical protein